MTASNREHLADHTKAAEAAGVSYNTAKRAFDQGWPKRNLPPIREVIEKEMLEARAQLAHLNQVAGRDRDARALAEQDMMDARVTQARVVRMGRNNAISVLSMAETLMATGIELAQKVETLLKDPAWQPTAAQCIALMRAIAQLSKDGVEQAKVIEELEARILGNPDVVVGVVSMSPDQAVATLIDGERTLDRLRRRAAQGDLPDGIPPALAAAIDTTAVEVAAEE